MFKETFIGKYIVAISFKDIQLEDIEKLSTQELKNVSSHLAVAAKNVVNDLHALSKQFDDSTYTLLDTQVVDDFQKRLASLKQSGLGYTVQELNNKLNYTLACFHIQRATNKLELAPALAFINNLNKDSIYYTQATYKLYIKNEEIQTHPDEEHLIMQAAIIEACAWQFIPVEPEEAIYATDFVILHRDHHAANAKKTYCYTKLMRQCGIIAEDEEYYLNGERITKLTTQEVQVLAAVNKAHQQMFDRDIPMLTYLCSLFLAKPSNCVVH